MLDRVSGKGAPVATVFFSGRPLYVNKELNRSDAFVAAWLPGTEGDGVADLLVKGPDAARASRGTLSYSWPATPVPDAAERRRRGLRAAVQARLRPAQRPEGDRAAAAGGVGRALRRQRRRRARRPRSSSCSSARTSTPYKSYIGSPDNWGGTRARQRPERGDRAHEHRGARPQTSTSSRTPARSRGRAARASSTCSPPEADLRPYLNSDGAIVFDTIVTKAPTARVRDQRALHVPVLLRRADHEGLRRPRRRGQAHGQGAAPCLDTGTLEFDHINTPFLIYTEGEMEAAFANVRWVPGAAKDADALKCSDLTE